MIWCVLIECLVGALLTLEYYVALRTSIKLLKYLTMGLTVFKVLWLKMVLGLLVI